MRTAADIDPARVRSLDAIHLAAAVELHAAGHIDAVLTYDHQLQTGCEHHGLDVLAPGPEEPVASERQADTDLESHSPEPPAELGSP